jgi:hypothetical protein
MADGIALLESSLHEARQIFTLVVISKPNIDTGQRVGARADI